MFCRKKIFKIKHLRVKNSIEINFHLRSIIIGSEIYYFDTLVQEGNYLFKASLYLANLNIANHNSDLWWSYSFTSKNPLSTKLLSKVADLLALKNFLLSRRLDIKSVKLFESKIEYEKFLYISIGTSAKPQSAKSLIISFLKNLIDFGKFSTRVIECFFWHYFKKIRSVPEILIFSYVDGAIGIGNLDPYFGDLKDILEKENTQTSIGYLLYPYSPFFNKFDEIKKRRDKKSYVIFDFLKIHDYIWVVRKILSNRFRLKAYEMLSVEYPGLEFVVKSEMNFESMGAQLYNLLIYKAASRIKSFESIQSVIYPFENKSLEKMLIIGLGDRVNKIGYQHSSISKRHFNFILMIGEEKITPLPDKIVTTGNIPNSYLRDSCNIAQDKLCEGFYLRGGNINWCHTFKVTQEMPNLLFAFSSGYEEIIDAVNFLKGNSLCGLNIKFRPHINFKFEGLPPEFLKWIKLNVAISEAEDLQEDLLWSDIVVCISSTVSLTAIQVGIPVIILKIGTVDSTPILEGGDEVVWLECTYDSYLKAVKEIVSLCYNERVDKYLNGYTYVNRYFSAPTDSKLIKNLFIG